LKINAQEYVRRKILAKSREGNLFFQKSGLRRGRDSVVTAPKLLRLQICPKKQGRLLGNEHDNKSPYTNIRTFPRLLSGNFQEIHRLKVFHDATYSNHCIKSTVKFAARVYPP
jgi:hypothetical protein